MNIKKERKLNRWQGFDYSWPGLYFVTSCIKGKEELFGEVRDNKMYLNDVAQIVLECWNDLPKHYKNCRLDEYIIMPDHIHGIIEIIENENYFDRKTVGTGFKPVPTQHGLAEIIRGFKTFSSRKINQNQNNFHFQWQRSYYDRVIRSEKELQNIREYISTNPINWENDRNNPLSIKYKYG